MDDTARRRYRRDSYSKNGNDTHVSILTCMLSTLGSYHSVLWKYYRLRRRSLLLHVVDKWKDEIADYVRQDTIWFSSISFFFFQRET